MELMSCWIALEDATESNGCMYVQPGGHTKGPLPHEGEGDYLMIPRSL